MILQFILTFYLLHCCQSAGLQPRRRYRYGDSGWPDQQTWMEFNATISGHLVRTFPPAAVCHNAQFDAALCMEAKEEWDNSFWRTNQTGAYTAIAWELGSEQCFINSSRSEPCDQGLVPHYSVAAHSIEDIQTAVKFASEKDLYLVVKNTGHDHLGRSSGNGAFSIWTHNLKGREWTNNYVVEGAPEGTAGVPAVTLQAGEQWLDVYQAAARQGVIVVGGHARTVGAAGGWVTGGGHSAWSNLYGLGVDNVLQISLVDSQGNHKVLNQYTDPDYFWAIRGGGGSAWGVVTSVTYKTHPEPAAGIQVIFVQINATTDSSLRPVLKKSLGAIVNVTDAGYTGYALLAGGFSAIFIRPGGTEGDLQRGLKGFYEVAQIPGASAVFFNVTYPRWINYTNDFLSDPNIAQNVMDASRLLTPEIALNKADQVVDLIFELGIENAPAFNFIGHVNSEGREDTSVHPAWKEGRGILSFGVNWNDTAPESEKKAMKEQLVHISNRWDEIAGPQGGTYVNEANPYEPNWQSVFWGSNYERLLKIKHAVDPSNLFVCNRCVGTDLVYEP